MIKLPIILIDNGHGCNTPGKCSPDASNGRNDSPLYFKEFSWTRMCACGIVDVLTAEGYSAFLLVKEKEDVPLKERTDRIKTFCAHYGTQNVIVVSIHVNAAGSDKQWHDARGFSIYTSPGVTKSDKLATCIYKAAEEELVNRQYGTPYGNTFGKGKQKPLRSDWSDGDPDYEAKFWILTQHPATAVLAEFMFQDNKEDVRFLRSDNGLGACIQLTVQGIEDYIEKYWKK